MEPRRDEATTADTSRITIAGHQVNLSEALKEHATTQLLVIAGKYFGGAENITATFSRTAKGGFGCSIRIHAGHGLHFDGQAETTDAYIAFNQALERVAKQLRRRKRALREDKPINPTKQELL